MADGTDKDNGDYLGYGVYAQTLWHRIEAALNKDVAHRETALREDTTPPQLGDDPLVVGLFGEWGAGKSKLLSLIQKLAEAQRKEQIEEHKFDGYKAITVPVFFQPWKYEHEKHLLVPLMLHILVELESTLAKARNGEDIAAGAALAVARGMKSVLSAAAKKVGDLSQAVAQVMGVADPIVTSPMAALLQMLAHGAGDLLAGKAKRRPAREFAHADNGRSYYEMHRILSEVTRPAKNPHVAGDQHHDKDFCINFVIFIDDLDRCLPEKAVETLELIKTVFNLESFAFVLALDEEVVERGIGHRYKDYALQNKRPEMPITGFEYLEKIVHLPFRLPGLTPQKALQFLQQYEEEHVLSAHLKGKYNPQAWMCERKFELHKIEPLTRGSTIERGAGWRRGDSLQKAESVTLNLAALVVNSFDAHVPRKLVRVVELFHQTLAVLTHRGRFDQVVPGGLIDPRLLMAFVLLQLFQPDLYRTCRRSLTGFNVLLDATKEPEKAMLESRPAAKSLSKRTSDADLWHWAVGWVGDKPPVSQRAALLRVPDLQPLERHEAQRIQLPLAGRLVEHRATQRHVFDAMRLFEQLRPLHEESGAQPTNSAVYFGVLALVEEANAVDGSEFEVLRRKDVLSEAVQTHGLEALVAGANDETVVAGTLPPLQGVFVSHDLDELHAILTSGQDAERKRLYEQVGLPAGETLNAEREEALLSRLEAEQRQIAATNARELSIWRSRVLVGLSYLAPHLDRVSSGTRWWALVREADTTDSPVEPLKSKAALQSRARWMDVQAALGQDQRFDPELFYLPKNRHFNHDVQKEPLPGFVWVQKERADFEPVHGSKINLDPFLMARYLTTVDQFAAFVDGGGYSEREWWDSQGWAWVTGEWDCHETTSPWLKKDRLVGRPVDERNAPDRWHQRRHWGGRPVWGVSWFEARAYARWLNEQASFRAKLIAAGLSKAQVELPIEAQWERAARASGFDSLPDGREFIWGDATGSVELKANVRGSGLDGACPVGLFPASPLGLCDLHGNLWEWQDNLHMSKGRLIEGERIPLLTSPIGMSVEETDWLAVAPSFGDSSNPALRGGSWLEPALPVHARFKKERPDYWNHHIGFRVVLSLAE